AAAGVLWTGAAALAVWPHALCYTNELWGGTRGGYVYVSDANYDWGQGLKELARWRRRQGLGVLPVWYFGTDPALRRLGRGGVPLQGRPIRGPRDVRARVGGGYLAVSTTLVHGVAGGTEAHRHATAFLRTRRPVARTMTFLIFD